MNDIHLSTELIILGGAASFLVEFLRALILKIEDHPRLLAIWKYLPSLFGMIGVLLFPAVVPTSSTLILLAHGAMSPVVFYVAYPLLKAMVVKKTEAQFALPTQEPPALVAKEGDPK